MASHGVRQFGELKDWLATKGESGRAFCLRAGIEKSAGSRLLNGQFKDLDFSLVEKVSAATDSAIGAAQFSTFKARLKALDAKKRARAKRRAA